MRIALPKSLYEIDLAYGPLFFLAGPVRGADDWQLKGCLETRKRIPRFYAALPCRYGVDHPLISFEMKGVKDHFDRQLPWERFYMEMAAMVGCLIFWLPCESKIYPRTGGEPYAMDTRGELGEWRGRLMNDPDLRIVIGAEPGFPGLSQISRNFSLATKSDFPIYGSLAETIAAAIKMAK